MSVIEGEYRFRCGRLKLGEGVKRVRLVARFNNFEVVEMGFCIVLMEKEGTV